MPPARGRQSIEAIVLIRLLQAIAGCTNRRRVSRIRAELGLFGAAANIRSANPQKWLNRKSVAR